MLPEIVVLQKLFKLLESNVVTFTEFLIGKFLVLDLYDMATRAGQPNIIDANFLPTG